MQARQTLRDDVVTAALRESPRRVVEHVERAQLTGMQRVAVTARIAASRHSLFGAHANSIKAAKVGEMHFEVRAGTNYARMLEEGTGPAAGRQAYMPNPVALREYVKRRAGIRWKGRPGSRGRLDQMREVRDRAFALALHIRKHGTKPHPIMRPAFEQHLPQLLSDVRVAAFVGARETFAAKLKELRG